MLLLLFFVESIETTSKNEGFLILESILILMNKSNAINNGLWTIVCVPIGFIEQISFFRS